MDYAADFLKCCHFLTQLKPLWHQPVLARTKPLHLDLWTEWQQLSLLSEQRLYEIFAQKQYHLLPPSALRQLIQDMDSYTQSFQSPDCQVKPQRLPQGLRPKKWHEISHVLAHLSQEQGSTAGFVDLAGGCAHLSHHLINGFAVPSCCIDFDPALLAKGSRLYAAQVEAGQLQLQQADLKELIAVPGHLDQHSTTIIGLHSCGALAHAVMKLFLGSHCQNLLLVSCCYNRLDPERELPLSQTALQQPLRLSDHGLTLAVRSHHGESLASFTKRRRVKAFRYALHLYLQRYLPYLAPAGQPISLGPSPGQLYRQSFATYAQQQLERIAPQHRPSARQLNDFYRESIAGPQHQAMLLWSLLSGLAGRALEMYVVLDRALWLQEQRCEVRVQAIFDEAISPRNLALTVSKENLRHNCCRNGHFYDILVANRAIIKL